MAPDIFTLRDRVMIVTGGGEGIGRAIARMAAAMGAQVAVVDIDPSKAQSVVNEIVAGGGDALAVEANVAHEALVEEAVHRVLAAYGRVDVLVNNAATSVRATAVDYPLDAWNSVVSVNLTGPFLCSRAAARRMSPGSAIVNIASTMGLTGGLYPNVCYMATKGGVVNMTRALALEWAPQGIRVNAVAPTFTRTAFVAAALADPERSRMILEATPMGRIAEPDEVAAAVVFLASPAASMITGVILPVDGGYLAR